MPSNQSQEKIDLLKTLGAQVELTTPAPFASADNYYHVARKRSEEIENDIFTEEEKIQTIELNFGAKCFEEMLHEKMINTSMF